MRAHIRGMRAQTKFTRALSTALIMPSALRYCDACLTARTQPFYNSRSDDGGVCVHCSCVCRGYCDAVYRWPFRADAAIPPGNEMKQWLCGDTMRERSQRVELLPKVVIAAAQSQ